MPPVPLFSLPSSLISPLPSSLFTVFSKEVTYPCPPYKDYKELIVWQKSRLLVKSVYLQTKKLPRDELFGLTNQVRRAVVSIPSNIAEGYNRHSDKEFIHFLKIAKGSAAEVETQLILCMDLEYLAESDIRETLSLVGEVLRMLGSLIIAMERRKGSSK